jgi:hypothetical protein
VATRVARAAKAAAGMYPICESGTRMVSPRSMPEFLRFAPTMIYMECSPGCSLDVWHQEIWNTRNEQFVRWSTWRLAWWEAEMRLPPRPNSSYDERRDRIIARMRAWALPTVANIMKLADAYGAVVYPTMNYEQHFITYIFPGGFVGQEDLMLELDRITPARLGLNMQVFVVWGDFESANNTWCQIEDAGWSWDDMENASLNQLPPLSLLPCVPPPPAYWGDFEDRGIRWCQPGDNTIVWGRMETATIDDLPDLANLPCNPPVP